MRYALLSFLVAGFLSFQGINGEDQASLAKDVYIYGYPLVLMDVTKNSFTNDDRSKLNQFVHLREFPNANFHDVVSPNADTLYSSAWLDLSKEPILLSVPEIKSRYYLLELLDEWTNVISSIGTRTNGGKKSAYAIVGPNWKGDLPKDVIAIHSPTNYVWILGRTETKGPKDYSAVHKIQDEYSLMTLGNTTKPNLFSNYVPNKAISPVEKVTQMDAATFFTKLNHLITEDAPLPPQDAEIEKKMAGIGIVPGKKFDSNIAFADQLTSGIKQGLEQIIGEWNGQKFARKENGWLISTGNVGNYGTDYPFRAVIAYGGLGANLVKDAIYPMARIDSTGKSLDGNHRYVMHFESAPPVNAFWSVTMYNDQQFFVENPINRYNIGSHDSLKINEDGSFDIYIQNASPGKEKESNWLPAPQGGFNLMMRLYYPKEEILNGQWKPPIVKRIQ